MRTSKCVPNSFQTCMERVGTKVGKKGNCCSSLHHKKQEQHDIGLEIIRTLLPFRSSRNDCCFPLLDNTLGALWYSIRKKSTLPFDRYSTRNQITCINTNHLPQVTLLVSFVHWLERNNDYIQNKNNKYDNTLFRWTRLPFPVNVFIERARVKKRVHPWSWTSSESVLMFTCLWAAL